MAELYITRLQGGTDEKIVRIDAREGSKLLGRIEVQLEDFAAAVMGLGAVPAWFTTERDEPGKIQPRIFGNQQQRKEM